MLMMRVKERDGPWRLREQDN